MFADPQTITLDGAGGTAKNLVKINQDSYGSEYLLQETLSEYRLKIRHSTETTQNGGASMLRHNVELTQKVYAAGAVPEFIRQIYVIARHKQGDDMTVANDLFESLPYWLTEANITKLLAWES